MLSTAAYNSSGYLAPASGYIDFSNSVISLAPSLALILDGASITGSMTSSGRIVFDSSVDTLAEVSMAGTGSVEKTGDSVLTLTGTNTYSGGTTVSGGTLQIGNGGTSGSITGNTTNNASLVFNRSNDLSYGGNVSGTGSLTKQGSGALTLSGTSTYSGGTTLSAGALVIGSNGALGSDALTIEDGTILSQTSGTKTLANDLVIHGDFERTAPGGGDQLHLNGNVDLGGSVRSLDMSSGENIRFFGSISNGGLTFTNSNTKVSYNGSTDNTYTGLTTVQGGTLGLQKDADVIAIAGDLVIEPGAIVTQNSNNQIADSAELTVDGTYNLIDSSQTIDSLLGSGSVFLNTFGSDQQLTVRGGNFSGQIEDDGLNGLELVKSGTGTLTLSGTNTYSGGTTISGGTLLLSNATGSGTGSGTVNVNNGGTLAGTGTVGGNVVVHSGGVLSPGNSPGIFNITGDLTLNSGSISNFEINGTTPGTGHDQIVVGGTATLGGTLNLYFANGLAGDDTFTLIDAAAISGDFDSVVNVLNNALTFQTSITDDYILTLTAVQSDFAPFALTPNQLAVAKAIDDHALSGSINDLINHLNSLPGSSLPGSFDQIAPTPFASIPSAAFANTRSQLRGLSNHMIQRRAGPVPTADESRWGMYTGGGFGRLDLDGDRNGPGYDSDSFGPIVGVDYRVSDSFILGFYTAYNDVDFDFGGNGGDVQGDATTFGLYGTWFNQDDYWVEGSIGTGHHSYDTTRRVLGATAVGDTNASEFQISARSGRDFAYGKREQWTLTPSIGLSYNHLRTDGFTETGSLAPLAMSGQSHSSLESQAQLRLSQEHEWNGIRWMPYLNAGWHHEFLDRSHSIDARFASGGSLFTVDGPRSPRDRMTLGAGLNAMLNDSLSVGLSYNSDFNSSSHLHQFDAFLSFDF